MHSALLALMTLAAPAADAPPATPPATAPDAAKPAPTGPTVVSVLMMPVAHKEGVSKDLADQVTAVITHIASSLEGFRIVAVTDVEGAMSHDQLQQLAGCDSISCAAEIGGALNTDEVMLGSLGRVGSQYLLSLTRIRSKDATRSGSVIERVEAEPQSVLFDKLNEVVPHLFGKTSSATAIAVVPKSSSTDAKAKPAEEEGEGIIPKIIRGLFRAVGVLGLAASVPPTMVAGVLGLGATVLMVVDGGPALPGVPKNHNINPLQAIGAEFSGATMGLSIMLGIVGLGLGVVVLVISLVLP